MANVHQIDGPSAEVHRARPEKPAGRAGVSTLDTYDFHDVFGGPPRTVLLRGASGKLSAGEIRQGTFYDEIFRPADPGIAAAKSGRNLPGFRIPKATVRGGLVRTEEGFYDDIFGSDSKDRRSRPRSKSKSNSSSVLSSEDLSPLRPSIAEDAMLAFASKLRPITIPTRRPDSSPRSTPSAEEQSSHRSLIAPRSSFTDSSDRKASSSSTTTTDFFRHQQKCHVGFPCCCFSPPRPIRKRLPGSGGDDAASPSSVISSVFLEPGREVEAAERYFAFEIDKGCHGSMGEREGAVAVAEAIAWAKEKFWNQKNREEAAHEKKALMERKRNHRE